MTTHPTLPRRGARLCAALTLALMPLAPRAAQIVHDTSAEFAAGSFTSLQDTGAGSSPQVRLAYNLPYGFGSGKHGVYNVSGSHTFHESYVQVGYCRLNNGIGGTTTINVTDVQGGWRIQNGDIIMVYQMRGAAPASFPGQWELHKVVSGAPIGPGQTANLVLDTPLSYSYMTSGGNVAQVVRMLECTDVTINGGSALYSIDWAGSHGGLVAFLCSGTLTVNGTISTDARGFRGGAEVRGQSNARGRQAEGSAGDGGTQTTSANGNGGGGGQRWPGSGVGSAGPGAGGGNATKGEEKTDGGAENWESYPAGYSLGGAIVGNAPLTTAFFGGGGGSGGTRFGGGGDASGAGGDGGGMALIWARNVAVNGYLTANGGAGYNSTRDGMGAGGGGAGGSIKLFAHQATLGSSRVQANGAIGGLGGNANAVRGGTGGSGRIRVEYGAGGISGSTSPGASTAALGYLTVGTYRSPALATPTARTYGAIAWVSSGGTYTRFRTRSASTSGGLNSATWSGWISTSGTTIPSTPNEYIQYEAELAGNGSATPVLSRVTIDYTGNQVPSNPVLVEPPNGSLTNANAHTLVWQASDPEDDTLANYLTLSTNADWSNPIAADLNLGAATNYATGPLNDGTYYWKVRCNDAFGPNPSSPTWSFRIDATAPVAPVILGANRRADGVAGSLSGTGEDGTTLAFRDATYTPIPGVTAWNGAGAYIFTPSVPIPVGTTVFVRSTDEAGNWTDSIAGFTIAPYDAHLPKFVNHQGRMFDAAGEPFEGTISASVALFDADYGGRMLYTQQIDNVSVENGLFSMGWGDALTVTALTNEVVWLEMYLNGETLWPRQRILSAPYALEVAQAESVVDGAIGTAQLADQSVTASKRATPPLVFGHASADQTLAPGDAGLAIVAFDQETIDTASAYNPSTHTFTAPVDGAYLIHAHIAFGDGFVAGDRVRLAIHKNGAQARRTEVFTGGNRPRAQLSALLPLTAGDTIDFRAAQWTAASRLIDGDPTECRFSIRRLP